jgi:hypothetical protein
MKYTLILALIIGTDSAIAQTIAQIDSGKVALSDPGMYVQAAAVSQRSSDKLPNSQASVVGSYRTPPSGLNQPG